MCTVCLLKHPWYLPNFFRFRWCRRSFLDQNLLRITNPISDLTGDQQFYVICWWCNHIFRMGIAYCYFWASYLELQMPTFFLKRIVWRVVFSTYCSPWPDASFAPIFRVCSQKLKKGQSNGQPPWSILVLEVGIVCRVYLLSIVYKITGTIVWGLPARARWWHIVIKNAYRNIYVIQKKLDVSR